MNDMLSFLIDFEVADWVTVVLHGAVLYFFVIWVALVIWVARDVVGRTRKLVWQVLAIVLVALLNIFGLVVYMILRPQKTLLERYYEDLEQRALAEQEELCPHCTRPLPLDFQYCPACGAEARTPCKKCRRLVSEVWQSCAYCGTEKPSDKTKKETSKVGKKGS